MPLLISCTEEGRSADHQKPKDLYLAKLDVCSAQKASPDVHVLKNMKLADEQLRLILGYQDLKQLDNCLQPERARYLTFLRSIEADISDSDYAADLKVLISDKDFLNLELERYQTLPENIRAQAEKAFKGPFDPVEVGLKLLPMKD
jgi:hypothetical protein